MRIGRGMSRDGLGDRRDVQSGCQRGCVVLDTRTVDAS